MKNNYPTFYLTGICKLCFIVALILYFSQGVFAQTRGLIVVPATGSGASILDPNNDGYVSGSTAGFIASDSDESELPYVPFVFPGLEPTSDIENGPDCGFTDFVDSGGYDPALSYRDTTGNWLFRLRLGGIRPNAKSYSILLDTDGKFGNSGPDFDPDYTLANPGFEVEIVLGTKFGVYMYDVDGTPNCSPVIEYTGTDHYQKAIAYSEICDDPDYFLDFYVEAADLITMGINPDTPIRMAIVDNMAAKKSTVCNSSSASDVGGVGPCGSLANCYEQIIDNQGPCTLEQINAGLCLAKSECPSINDPINGGDTDISGNTSEADGTTIRVYKNSFLIGEVASIGGVWLLPGIVPLSSGDTINATAQAVDESVSHYDCNTNIVGAVCSAPVTDVIHCGKSISGTAPVAGATVNVYYNGVLLTPTGGTVWTGSEITVDANPIGSSGMNTADNFLWKCVGTGDDTGCNASGAACLINGVYTITVTEPGKCESSPVFLCIGTDQATSTPEILTSPITDATTSISGTIPSPDNIADIEILLYNDGLQIDNVTTTAGGVWSISNLSLKACDIITVKAIRPASGSGNSTIYYCVSEADSVTVSGGVSGIPEILGTYCITDSIREVKGISGEVDGTIINVFENGILEGFTTVTSGGWILSGVSIAIGRTITATAIATGECKLESSASDAVVVSTQSTNAGLAITTEPIVEQVTSISGTGTDGDIITLFVDDFEVDGASAIVSGSAWTISELNDYDLYVGGIVTVKATTPGFCESLPSASKVVECIPPSDDLTVNPAKDTICSGSTVNNIDILNSEKYVIYQLYLSDKITPTGTSRLGTGGTITFTSGILTSSTDFRVKAIKLPPDGSCEVFLTDSVKVTVFDPAAPTVGAITQPDCATNTGTVALSGLPTQSWMLTASPGGSTITGSTANADFSGLAADDTYIFTVTIDATGCTSGASRSAVVDAVFGAPSAPLLGTITQPDCATNTGTVALSGLPTQSWTLTASPGGSTITGSTANANFAGLAADNTYTFTITIDASNCTSVSSGNVVVDVIPSVPSAPSLGAITQPDCATNTGTVALSGLPTQSWTVTASPGGSTITGSTANANFAWLAANNTYTFRVTIDATGCTSLASGNTVVDVIPSVPSAPSLGAITQPDCATNTGTVALSGLPTQSWTVTASPGGSTITGSTTTANFGGLAADNTYTFRVTIDATGCTSLASGNAVVDAYNCAPDAVADYETTNEDVVDFKVPVLDNDTGGLTVSILEDPTSGGTVIVINDTLIYNPPTNWFGTDTIVYQICNDVLPTHLCDIDTVFITLTPVNDAPLQGNETVSADEDTPVDTDNVLINNSDLDGDEVSVNTFSLSPTSGQGGAVVFNPSDSSFTYTPVLNFNGNDTIFYEVCDNGSPQECVSDSIFIVVSPVNDAPLQGNETVSADEDTPVDTDNVLNNNSDLDGDEVSVNTSSLSPISGQGGAVVYNSSDSSFTYTPVLNFNGNDTIFYEVCDNGSPQECISDSIFIVVSPVNDAPSQGNETASADEDTPVNTDNILDNNSDLDGDDVSVNTSSLSPTSGQGGTVVFNPSDSSFTYTPVLNFNGNDTIFYEVCDNGSPQECVSDSIFIVVSPVNDTPTQGNETASADEDTPVNTDNVLDNNSDLDGDEVSVNTFSLSPISGKGGTVVYNPSDSSFTYTPVLNFNGNDTIFYEVCDNGSPQECVSDSIFIVVSPENNAPSQGNETASVNEDTPVDTDNVLDNNSDLDGDDVGVNTSSLSSISGQGGAVVYNPSDSSFTYTPVLNFNGNDTIFYEVCDNGSPQECVSDSIFIVVSPVNDAPSQGNETASADEDTPVDIDNVLNNNSDLDGDDVSVNTFSLSPTSGQGGTVVYNPLDSSFTYTPVLNFNGNDTIFYEVCDNGSPQECVSDSIFIVVSPVNDAPSQGNETASANEDTPVDTDNVLDNNSDLDGDDVGVNTSSLSPTSGQGGTVVYNPSDSSFTYTPVLNFNGNDTIFYEVCDNGSPQECVSDSIFIVVSPENNAPTAVDDSETINEDASVIVDVQENDLDVDGDELTTSLVSLPTNGTVNVVNSDSIAYQPNFDFIGIDTVFYRVCDARGLCDTAMVVIIVEKVLQQIVAVDDRDTIQMGKSLIIPVKENDLGLPEDVTITAPSTSENGGEIVLNEDGTITYTPPSEFTGEDTFEYTVTTDDGRSDNAIVIIIVEELVDPIIAVNDVFETTNGNSLSGSLVNNDSNPNGDVVINTTPIVQTEHGTLVINADGTFTYTPDEGFYGEDTFAYEICDAVIETLCSSAVVTIVSELDTDYDGIANNIDIDDDNDGIRDVVEGDGTVDTDSDGIPDSLDIDSDNDGIPDFEEGQAEGTYIAPLYVDTDNDGWDDAYDPDNSGIEFIPVDTDLDNKPDYRDADADNDGIPDSVEGHDANSDVKADVLPFGTDSDNDGLDDAYDSVYGWNDRNNSVGSNATLQDTNGDGVRDWRDNVPILPPGESVLFIPNGFSPNGDNVNDYFIIDFAKQFPDMRIEIFNRWGNKVYEKEKYGNEDRWGVDDAWWDGRSMYNWTVGDERLPAGTYFYILEFNDGTTKPRAGSVFLNR